MDLKLVKWSEVAKLLGVSQVWVHRIVHGRTPGRKQRPRIARILRISEEELDASIQKRVTGRLTERTALRPAARRGSPNRVGRP